jgi:2-methylcitrate dehydratase PrpD
MVNRPSTSMLRAATLGSGQFVMAVTALRGKIDLQSFAGEYLQSEEVQKLMTRVTVTASPELDRHFPKYWAGKVTLRSNDGTTDAEEIIAPKGESENPMSVGDVEKKFVGLAAPVIGDGKAKSVIAEVQALDTDKSLLPLLDALRTSA